MSMSISGIGGNAMTSMMGASMARKPPDPTSMTNQLFDSLDTDKKGYLEKSDFVSAYEKLDSSSGAGSSASVDDVFSTLDSNADGKLTRQEMADSLKSLAEELDSQFNAMRVKEGMENRPPPPPPQGEQDQGGSTSSSSDSGIAALLSSSSDNYEAADTNKDGIVSASEALAYAQKTGGTDSSSATAGVTSASSTSETAPTAGVTEAAEDSGKADVMRRITDLMRAYVMPETQGLASAGYGSLSVSA